MYMFNFIDSTKFPLESSLFYNYIPRVPLRYKNYLVLPFESASMTILFYDVVHYAENSSDDESLFADASAQRREHSKVLQVAKSLATSCLLRNHSYVVTLDL